MAIDFEREIIKNIVYLKENCERHKKNIKGIIDKNIEYHGDWICELKNEFDNLELCIEQILVYHDLLEVDETPEEKKAAAKYLKNMRLK